MQILRLLVAGWWCVSREVQRDVELNEMIISRAKERTKSSSDRDTPLHADKDKDYLLVTIIVVSSVMFIVHFSH